MGLRTIPSSQIGMEEFETFSNGIARPLEFYYDCFCVLQCVEKAYFWLVAYKIYAFEN